MRHSVVPYAMPQKIDPDLNRVLAYWEALKRRQNRMPFWDDVRISSLPDLAENLMLIDVFAKPERFRLDTVGRVVADRYGETVAGKFLDEMDRKTPFEYLLSQCSATVESAAPTYYQRGSGASASGRDAGAYARLLLPLWGDGHIGMLLGALIPG